MIQKQIMWHITVQQEEMALVIHNPALIIGRVPHTPGLLAMYGKWAPVVTWSFAMQTAATAFAQLFPFLHSHFQTKRKEDMEYLN